MTLPSSFSPGQPFGFRGNDGTLVLDRSAADLLNQMLAAVRGRRRFAAAAPLTFGDGVSGRHLALSGPTAIHAILSGSGNPYSFQQAYFDTSAGRFVALEGGHSGDNAYECNGKSGLDGKAVELLYEPMSNDWRFQWIAYGSKCQYCVVPSSTCGTGAVVGATVTISDDGTVVAACTTSGQVFIVTLTSPGSGYTDGTKYSLEFSGGGGTGAAGTFDVVGGQVTNLKLTDSGTGYTSAPTIDFSAAGDGTGATATAGVRVQCCMNVPKGTHTLTVSATGFVTNTQTITTTCGGVQNVAMTPNTALVRTGPSGCPGADLPGGFTVAAIQGGVTVASGTTNDLGIAVLTIPGGVPTTFEASDPVTGRFDPSSIDSDGFSPGCGVHGIDIPMTPASGFHCFPFGAFFGNHACALPASDTLGLSDSRFGACTLTWDGTLGGWQGTSGAGITYKFFMDTSVSPAKAQFMLNDCQILAPNGINWNQVSCPPSLFCSIGLEAEWHCGGFIWFNGDVITISE